MNIIQTLITSTPLGNTDFKSTTMLLCFGVAILCIVLGFLALASCKARWVSMVLLPLVGVVAVAVAFCVLPLFGTHGDNIPATGQSCWIDGKGITLSGYRITTFPSSIQIGGTPFKVTAEGDAPAEVGANAFVVQGAGWTMLRFLGLKTPIETELGIDTALRTELSGVIGKKADAIAMAMQSDSPTITRVRFREFVCRGSLVKEVYGAKTIVRFEVSLTSDEVEAMANNPAIAKEMVRSNLIAKR